MQQTKIDKTKRKQKDHDKYYIKKQQQKQDLAAGLAYESGIALQLATKKGQRTDVKS